MKLRTLFLGALLSAMIWIGLIGAYLALRVFYEVAKFYLIG